jgi:hypothetical protein
MVATAERERHVSNEPCLGAMRVRDAATTLAAPRRTKQFIIIASKTIKRLSHPEVVAGSVVSGEDDASPSLQACAAVRIRNVPSIIACFSFREFCAVALFCALPPSHGMTARRSQNER